MRWPFVTRGTYEAAIEMAKANFAMLHENWRECRERYDALLAEHRAFVALVAERTAPPAKPVPPTPKPPRERDAADGAIELAAAFDPRRRRHLEQFVRARRAEGVKAEDIAQEVLHPPADGMGEWEMPE